MISVISTGLNAKTKFKCLASVKAQTCCEFEHIYVEASTQSPILSSQVNYRDAIFGLPDDRIVVLLDGDDWFAGPETLAHIQDLHNAGAWVTYGSFVHSDGRKGFSAPYLHSEDVRASPWRASHTKSFLAGLYKKIRQSDFTELAHDMPLMFALIEMSGHDRSYYNPDVGYVYNLATSYEFNADEAGLQAEQEANKKARELPPYSRLETL